MKLKSLLKYLTEGSESFNKFNFNEFKKLKTYKEMINYVTDNDLKRIGCGISPTWTYGVAVPAFTPASISGLNCGWMPAMRRRCLRIQPAQRRQRRMGIRWDLS